jgi:hypothetical protein
MLSVNLPALVRKWFSDWKDETTGCILLFFHLFYDNYFNLIGLDTATVKALPDVDN